MCRALYAPMRVLRLADQKSPAMDKLYYYVLQTDRMLAMYCKDADDRGVALLTAPTIRVMDCSTSAGLSDEDLGSEDEDNGVDDNDDNDSISAQSSATVTSMTTAVMMMISKYLCGLLLSFNASCNILTHVLLFEFITTDLLKMSGVATA